MRFSNQGDSIIFVGDLLNFNGEALDRVFEQVFRVCTQSVNLQHFNRNSISNEDFVQFNLEHTDFVDYVFSSRNVKFSDLRFETLVGGVVNWLNILAQSNRQMNIDNDWAISLQVSHTTEVPRGFGKDDEHLEVDVNEVPSSSPFLRVCLNVNVPRTSHALDALNDADVEEHLFGPISDEEQEENEEDDLISNGEDDYNEDSSTCCNSVTQNKVALQVLIKREMSNSIKITDYYEKGRVFNTPL